MREASRGEGGEHGETLPEEIRALCGGCASLALAAICAITSVWHSSVVSSIGTGVGVRGITNTGDDTFGVNGASGRRSVRALKNGVAHASEVEEENEGGEGESRGWETRAAARS